MAALQSDQGPLRSAVTGSGGPVTHAYQTVNAFAATVSRAERPRLAANPAVAEVLPDAFVPRPDPGATGPVRSGRSARAAGSGGKIIGRAADGLLICPSNPADPIVEPEALSIIHATEAQRLVSGSGVKVAFVADAPLSGRREPVGRSAPRRPRAQRGRPR